MSAAEDTAEALVDVWVEEVRRLVPEVRAVREKYDRDSRAMDRNDSSPPLTEHDMFADWRRLWAAQHHLVWAAHQPERWVARLARERRTKVPKPDPVLADLRNALEHLAEADLDESTATASSNPAPTKSLRKLLAASCSSVPAPTRAGCSTSSTLRRSSSGRGRAPTASSRKQRTTPPT